MWKMSYYLKHSKVLSHIILHIVCSSNARELCLKTRCPCVKFVIIVFGKKSKGVASGGMKEIDSLHFMGNICLFRQQLIKISMLLIK